MTSANSAPAKQGAEIEVTGCDGTGAKARDLAQGHAQAPAPDLLAQQHQAGDERDRLPEQAGADEVQIVDRLVALPGHRAREAAGPDMDREGEASDVPDIADAADEFAPGHLPGAKRRHALAVPSAAGGLLGHEIGGAARAPDQDNQQIDPSGRIGEDRRAVGGQPDEQKDDAGRNRRDDQAQTGKLEP